MPSSSPTYTARNAAPSSTSGRRSAPLKRPRGAAAAGTAAVGGTDAAVSGAAVAGAAVAGSSWGRGWSRAKPATSGTAAIASTDQTAVQGAKPRIQVAST